MTTTLAYWNIRGLGQTPRYLLHLAGVAFHDKQYADDSWYEDKKTLGPFANLPYLIEGTDAPLFQSKAIIQHLGRKYGFYGASAQEAARIDEVVFVVEDIRKAETTMAYSKPDVWAASKATYEAGLVSKLQPIEKHLTQRPDGQEWIASRGVSIADVFTFDVLDALLRHDAKLFETLPLTGALYRKVAALPAIAGYRASPAFPTRANGEEANF